MLKWIVQNKYKLMAFIIGLYLLIDVLQHKGQTRVLFPKNLPGPTQEILSPQSKSILINKDKTWKKGINTKAQVDLLTPADSGFECDIYFDTTSENPFNVNHDLNKNIRYTLENLLQLYEEKHLNASIWLDIKNLSDENMPSVLHALIGLRHKYKLHNRLLIESGRADLLTAFSDSGFYTSYYIPMFNPYQIDDAGSKFYADSIAKVLKNSRVNALSGYYFQSSFLHHYFPRYPVLTWVEKKSFSLVNLFFRNKLERDTSVFIILYS